MKVKPTEDWKMAGTGPDYIQLDKTKVYVAIHATNQPDWEEEGKIFVIGSSDECHECGHDLTTSAARNYCTHITCGWIAPIEDPLSTRLAEIGFLLKKGEYEKTEHDHEDFG
jgi:hypothetical protein